MSDITRQKTIDYLYYLKIHYPKNLIIPEYIDFAISSLEIDEAYQLEYESTTKNNLSSGTRKNSQKLENVSPVIDWNNCHTSEQLDSISTTKNDLGVDCISRADAIGSIAVECSAEKLDIDYSKFLMLRRAIKALPTVTPIRLKGHWIENAPEYQNIDPPYICSECGNMHLRKTNYCDQCGADMREVEE